MKISRAKRQINYVGNNRDQECRAFFEKPSRDPTWLLKECSALLVGMGSESDCLLGQLNRILEISDSEAGIKVEKSEGDKIESNSKTLNAKILSINLTDCTIKTQQNVLRMSTVRPGTSRELATPLTDVCSECPP